MEQQQPNQQQVQIQADPKISRGVYANNMVVGHTKEKFVLDFMNAFPPQGSLVARIFTSPGHMKRILKALQENVSNYEKNFDPIDEADAPQARVGFRA